MENIWAIEIGSYLPFKQKYELYEYLKWQHYYSLYIY